MQLNKTYSFVGINELAAIAESKISSDSKGQAELNATNSKNNIFIRIIYDYMQISLQLTKPKAKQSIPN